jgi:hypothetical protein
MFNPETIDAINWALCWFILGGIATGLTVWAVMRDRRDQIIYGAPVYDPRDEPSELGRWPL